MSGLSSDEAAENPHTFTVAELKFLHKLDCAIDNAYIETKEFALYSVLGILLGMSADSFTIFEDPCYRVFVHTTPQDIFTGLARVQLGAGRISYQAIPDMTVRITRLYQDKEEKCHHLVLTVEAKRLLKLDGDARQQAAVALQNHIPQLMFQAFSAWSESHEQKCLYVGILIGPYLTVLVFKHPPNTDPNDLPSLNEDDDLLYAEGQHLCDMFPQEHAPQLVIYMEHIFKEPKDWKAGLSKPLQCIFYLATINLIKSFEPGIIQEPSNIFAFDETPKMPYNVKIEDEKRFNGIIQKWYQKSEKEKGLNHRGGEEEDSDKDENYSYSDQPSSSPQGKEGKRKMRTEYYQNKRVNYG